MKEIFKIGCIGISVILLIFIGALYFIFSPDEMCGNHLLKTEISPNKELKALIFSADCGATTDFSTQISIVKASYILEKSDNGNIFSADSDHGLAEMDGEILKLNVKWIDDENILIEYPKNTRIFKNKTSKNGVKIKYIEI